MPKRFVFRSFYRHKSSSSSSNSSFENNNNFTNKNTKKQQKIAEKMIKHGRGYDVLTDMVAPTFEEKTASYVLSINHEELDPQKEHSGTLDNHGKHDKRFGQSKHHGKYNNFIDKKMCEHSANKNDRPIDVDNFQTSRSEKDCGGADHSQSIQEAVSGVGKHHGKHHTFGHHKMFDHGDKKDNHHSPKDHSATSKNHLPNTGNHGPDGNGNKANRQHSIHAVLGGRGWHCKHRGKHNNFGHHKISEHGDQHDHHHSEVDLSFQEMDHRDKATTPDIDNGIHHKYAINTSHCKHLGKNHNFSHHKMFYQGDKKDHHHSQIDLSPQEMEHCVTTCARDTHNGNDLPGEDNSTEVPHKYVINTSHCQHLGRNHNFSHHRIMDYGDKKEHSNSQANNHGTAKEHCKDDLRNGYSGHNGLSGRRSHSIHDLFSAFRGLGGHGKHHGRHHNFGHHERFDYHDLNNNHDSKVDNLGTQETGTEIPNGKEEKNRHGGKRRHSIHDIFSGLGKHGGHDKHHGKHHHFGDHKRSGHGNKIDKFPSQVDISYGEIYNCGTATVHDTHNGNSGPAEQKTTNGHNKYTIIADHCKDHGKQHNFSHHNMAQNGNSPHGHDSELDKHPRTFYLHGDDVVTNSSQ